jgi:GNAT superfamily N-acetyltransferase
VAVTQAAMVVLLPVDGPPPGDEMANVHAATAAVAYAHIFSTPFPLDEARSRWNTHTGRVWLARRAGVLVGFAAATGVELDGLYVLPSESGAGIGSALLEAIGDVRRLWVLQDNHASRFWYERRGWRDSGERQWAYDVWDARYVR